MYALYNVLPPEQRAAVSSTDPGLLPEDAFRTLILALGYDDTTHGFNTKDVRDYLFRRMAVGAIQDFVWEVYGHRQHQGNRLNSIFTGDWVDGDNIIVLGLAPEHDEHWRSMLNKIDDALKFPAETRPGCTSKRVTLPRGNVRRVGQQAVVEPADTRYGQSLQIAAYTRASCGVAPTKGWGCPHAVGIQVRALRTQSGEYRLEKVILDSAKSTAKLLSVRNLAESLVQVFTVMRFRIVMS
jgi:hypothetical protein